MLSLLKSQKRAMTKRLKKDEGYDELKPENWIFGDETPSDLPASIGPEERASIPLCIKVKFDKDGV